MNSKVIAFCGNGPGAGKTEAAMYVERKLKSLGYDAKTFKFAEPIYSAIHAMCDSLHIEFDKNAVRPIMQSMGSTLRASYGKDFWVSRWELAVKTELFFEGLDVAVNDDARYDNEAAKISEMGGKIIKIESNEEIRAKRGVLQGSNQHESEKGIYEEFIYASVANDGTLKDLYTNLDTVLATLGYK